MRRILSIMIVALMSVAMSASAQFVTTEHKSSAIQPALPNKGWNSLYLEWNPSSSYIDGDSWNFTGFSVGYNHSFRLSHSKPFYLETGLGLQYSFDNDDYTYDNWKNSSRQWFLSAKIPVNLIYAFQIPNSSIILLPYAGLGLRSDFYGNFKNTIKNLGDNVAYYGINNETVVVAPGEEITIDSNSSSNIDNLSIGCQVGIKALIAKHILLGAGYHHDIVYINHGVSFKAGYKGGDINIGYVF
jgi:hypothetical protein